MSIEHRLKPNFKEGFKQRMIWKHPDVKNDLLDEMSEGLCLIIDAIITMKPAEANEIIKEIYQSLMQTQLLLLKHYQGYGIVNHEHTSSEKSEYHDDKE